MSDPPLKGLKVVDLSTVLMGPYVTQIMADLGAEVIKVESPEGDPVRHIGPFKNPGMGPIFLQANRGKKSLVLDLKTTDGREALLRLIGRSDALITNIRRNALERLRLDYPTVRQSNARLIYAFLSGYGPDGPYADRPAYDDLIQGLVGLPTLFMAAGAGSPRYAPIALADRVVALYATTTILSAVVDRQRTGLGQKIEIPMFETLAQFVLGDHMGGALFDPPIGPMGYQRLLSHDRRPYKTSDGFICVMIYTDLQWERFLPAVDMPRSILDAPKFRSISARTENIDELYAMVARKLEGLSTADCAFRLEAADVPFSVLNSLESLVVDPHLQAVDFFETTAHPSEGDLRMPSATAMFSSSESRPAGPAPRLGEHSREILVDLGYAAHEVQALIDGGVSRADGDGRPGSGG